MFNKIKEAMNWFGAVDFNEITVDDKTLLQCFIAGAVNEIKRELPYWIVAYSIYGIITGIKKIKK